MVALAGMAVLGFLFAAEDSAEFWFHALLDPSRAGDLAYMANQSLRGVLHRINPANTRSRCCGRGCRSSS